jgi:hypothetical protein
VKENRLKLAAVPQPPAADPLPNWVVPTFRGPRTARSPEVSFALEMENFTNYIKCSLSRIGTDHHQRAEFFKQSCSTLDAMEAEPPNRTSGTTLLRRMSK